MAPSKDKLKTISTAAAAGMLAHPVDADCHLLANEKFVRDASANSPFTPPMVIPPLLLFLHWDQPARPMASAVTQISSMCPLVNRRWEGLTHQTGLQCRLAPHGKTSAKQPRQS